MSLCSKEHKVGRVKKDILIIGVFGRSLFYKHYHYVDNSIAICSTRLLLLPGMEGWSMDVVFVIHKQITSRPSCLQITGKQSFCFLVSHHCLDNLN